MMAKIKAGLLSLRDLFATAWWIILLAGIGFAIAYQFVEPAMRPFWPRTASRWKFGRRPVRWKIWRA